METTVAAERDGKCIIFGNSKKRVTFAHLNAGFQSLTGVEILYFFVFAREKIYKK
ncbi:MAG: hypothetical protein IKA49_02155 [Alistipes sp.]|nr:hypothetical protein [Alistipes sp.]